MIGAVCLICDTAGAVGWSLSVMMGCTSSHGAGFGVLPSGAASGSGSAALIGSGFCGCFCGPPHVYLIAGAASFAGASVFRVLRGCLGFRVLFAGASASASFFSGASGRLASFAAASALASLSALARLIAACRMMA